MQNTIEHLDTIYAPALILFLDAQKILHNLICTLLNGSCCIYHKAIYRRQLSWCMQQFLFNGMLIRFKIFYEHLEVVSELVHIQYQGILWCSAFARGI